jgi:hypothetical protein
MPKYPNENCSIEECEVPARFWIGIKEGWGVAFWPVCSWCAAEYSQEDKYEDVTYLKGFYE